MNLFITLNKIYNTFLCFIILLIYFYISNSFSEYKIQKKIFLWKFFMLLVIINNFYYLIKINLYTFIYWISFYLIFTYLEYFFFYFTKNKNNNKNITDSTIKILLEFFKINYNKLTNLKIKYFLFTN